MKKNEYRAPLFDRVFKPKIITLPSGAVVQYEVMEIGRAEL